MNKRGESMAPGTCGELVQGFGDAGSPFHVTCPITLYASAEVVVSRASRLSISGLPGYATKMRQSIEHTARILNLDGIAIEVRHETSLDTGKGMGSSTADILSVATALAKAVDKTITPEQLGKIATSIESSDGTMYPGVAAVNHKNGELLRAFPWWPRFTIAMIVPRDILDTACVRFDGKEALVDQFNEILGILERASLNKDEKAFARAALMSADLNQDYVPNSLFAKLRNRFSDLGAIGLNVAHTGTIVGVLFGSSDDGLERCRASIPEIRALAGENAVIHTVRLEGKRAW
jgi:L-threonine kinase